MILAFNSACSTTESVEHDGEEIPAQEPTPITEAFVNQCDNIFYPLALDNQWIYRISIDQVSVDDKPDLALTVSENSGASAQIATLDYSSGIVTQSAVMCQDGEIISFPVTELNMILGMLSGELNLEFARGRFMPSEKEFEDNNWSMEWETEYIANGNLQGTYEGETLTALLSQSPVKMTWMIVGTGETVQVAAGAFENLVKINRVIAFDVSSLQANIDGSEVNTATTLTINTNLWYAPHIGMVKQEIESATVKFFGINFPIEAAGSVELIEYTLQ